MKIIDLSPGVVFHKTSKESQFYQDLKKILNFSSVTVFDPCCSVAGTSPQPTRVNPLTNALETFDGTNWIEFGTSGGASATSITAFAGGGQTSATALTVGYNEITTVATAGDSVKLPTAIVNSVVIVKNEGAASLNVFPFLADTINDQAVNLAVSVAPGATVVFSAINSTNWEASNQVISTNIVSESTVNSGVTVDGVLLKDGGVSNSGVTMIAAFYPQVAQNDIAAGTGGAIAVTNYLTTINTDADGDTFTLANGTQIGQMKKIQLVVDGGGDGVVTPATALAGGTTITFNDATDFIILQWSGAAWVVQENSGTIIA
jgi:hypothetical protein